MTILAQCANRCAEAKGSRAMQKAAATKDSAVLREGDGTRIQSQDLVEA